jgi:hypothetical protein
VPTPQAAPPPSAPSLPVSAPPPPDDESDEEYDEFWDTFDEAPDAPLPLMARLRRLPPFVVLLSVASLASVAFLAVSVTRRSIEIPVLIAAAVVTGILFASDTVVLARSTYIAGGDGRGGLALLLALAGGVAAVVAGLSFGWAAVMVLLGS